MEKLIIFFLPIIIILGAVTSYGDIKEGKIRNKYTFSALLCAIILNIFLATAGISYLKYVLIWMMHVIFALILGLLLYFLGYWSAGDTKLFVAFAALIPTTIYSHPTALSSLELLINTLVPVFTYLVINLVFKTSLLQKTYAIRKAANIKTIVTSLLLVFGLSWIIKITINYIGIKGDYTINLLVLIVLSRLIQKIFAKERMLLFLVVLSATRIIFDSKYIMSSNFVYEYLLFTTGYILVSLFLNAIANTYYEEKGVFKLKEGMLPLEAITKEGRKMNLLDAQKMTKSKVLFFPEKTGLTKNQVNRIVHWNKIGKLHFNTIKIKQTLPLAPFLFFGTILTLIFGGNAIGFLRGLLI